MPAFSQPHGYMAGTHSPKQFYARDSSPYMMPMSHYPQGYTPGQMSPATTQQTDRTRELHQFMYQNGFVQGQFSDTIVHVPTLQISYPLHALVLARSPMLGRLLNTNQYSTSHTITLDVNDKISALAFHHVLGHLYRPMNIQNLRDIFNKKSDLLLEIHDLARLLELEDVQNLAIEVMTSDTDPDRVACWVQRLADFPHTAKWTTSYLVQTLPLTWRSFVGHGSPGDQSHWDGFFNLVRIYAMLPLESLKQCLEHADLPVADTMQRFNLAKQVVIQCPSDHVTVVLGFTGGNIEVKVVLQHRKRKMGRWNASKQ